MSTMEPTDVPRAPLWVRTVAFTGAFIAAVTVVMLVGAPRADAAPSLLDDTASVDLDLADAGIRVEAATPAAAVTINTGTPPPVTPVTPVVDVVDTATTPVIEHTPAPAAPAVVDHATAAVETTTAVLDTTTAVEEALDTASDTTTAVLDTATTAVETTTHLIDHTVEHVADTVVRPAVDDITTIVENTTESAGSLVDTPGVTRTLNCAGCGEGRRAPAATSSTDNSSTDNTVNTANGGPTAALLAHAEQLLAQPDNNTAPNQRTTALTPARQLEQTEAPRGAPARWPVPGPGVPPANTPATAGPGANHPHNSFDTHLSSRTAGEHPDAWRTEREASELRSTDNPLPDVRPD